MTKNIEGEVYQEVLLSKIHADEFQPRKDFNAARMANLISSIKEHGILNPLVVEQHQAGQYLLQDGERRYRACLELGVKKVPVIVVPETDSQDRLVKQFHLQEQHEGWSPTEKAVAIGQLSESMKLTAVKMAKLLSIPERTIRDYVGFWNLIERKEFIKSEIPISFAGYIIAARDRAKKIYELAYEKEFIKEKQQAIEAQIISQIKSGEIRVKTDITKLTDAFAKEADTIDTFIKGRTSVTKLYLDSNAKAARSVRNVRQLSGVLQTHLKNVLDQDFLDLLKQDSQAVQAVKRLQPVLDQLVSNL